MWVFCIDFIWVLNKVVDGFMVKFQVVLLDR